jgi:hypothetical protein
VAAGVEEGVPPACELQGRYAAVLDLRDTSLRAPRELAEPFAGETSSKTSRLQVTTEPCRRRCVEQGRLGRTAAWKLAALGCDPPLHVYYSTQDSLVTELVRRSTEKRRISSPAPCNPLGAVGFF